MKIFRNPIFAVVLCAILILCSTLLSVHIHFGAKCDQVKDMLFTGVESNGYARKGIATHLENTAASASGLATIARNYDIDTEDVEMAVDAVQMGLRYSMDYASYLHHEYTELGKAVNALADQLQRVELSERDADGVQQYLDTIAGAKKAIDEAGYNDQVREFLRKYDRFPTKTLAALAGVSMPEYFA